VTGGSREAFGQPQEMLIAVFNLIAITRYHRPSNARTDTKRAEAASSCWLLLAAAAGQR